MLSKAAENEKQVVHAGYPNVMKSGHCRSFSNFSLPISRVKKNKQKRKEITERF